MTENAEQARAEAQRFRTTYDAINAEVSRMMVGQATLSKAS